MGKIQQWMNSFIFVSHFKHDNLVLKDIRKGCIVEGYKPGMVDGRGSEGIW